MLKQRKSSRGPALYEHAEIQAMTHFAKIYLSQSDQSLRLTEDQINKYFAEDLPQIPLYQNMMRKLSDRHGIKYCGGSVGSRFDGSDGRQGSDERRVSTSQQSPQVHLPVSSSAGPIPMRPPGKRWLPRIRCMQCRGWTQCTISAISGSSAGVSFS